MLSGSIWAGGVIHPFFLLNMHFLLHSGIIITNKRGLYFLVHIHSNNLFNIYNFFTYNLLFVIGDRWECVSSCPLWLFASNQMKCLFVIFLHIKFSLHLLKMSVYFAVRTEFFFHSISIKSTLLSSNSMIFLSYFFFVQFSLFFFLNIVLWPKKIKLKKMWSFWIALTLIN